MITSLSRWWDPPIQTSRACRIGAGESGSGKAMRHRQQLPAGNPIHDYIFEIEWQKNGAAHKALPRIPFQTKLALIQSLWCSGSKPRSTAPAARRDKNRRGPDPGASHSWRVPPSQQAPWSRARRDSAKPSEAKRSQAEGLRAKPAFKAVSFQRTFHESRAMTITVRANSRLARRIARLAGRHVE